MRPNAALATQSAPASRRSAACSSSAAEAAVERCSVERDDRHHLADGGRGEDLVRLGEPREQVHAFDDRIATRRGELEQRRPCLSGEDPELERRREERHAFAPPDVRHRSLEDDALVVDEDRVVRTPALRLRLGRDVRRVADRLRPREQPRRRCAAGTRGSTSRCPRARISSSASGSGATSATETGTAPTGPGVWKRRSTASARPASSSTSPASTFSSARSGAA